MAQRSTSSSRVLVTGGAGFIGSALARRLVAAGHDVIIVDKGLDERHHCARLALPEARWITADLLAGDPPNGDLVDLVGSVDKIVHLAGQPGVQTSWGAGFDQHLTANVLLTQRLLEAALVTKPQRVVIASSSSVYGDIAVGTAHETQPLRPLSPYGVSKAAVEQLMGAYVARGVEAVALRFFTVYGRAQRPDMALARIIDAALGGPTFAIRNRGRQSRDFTHVDDIATAIEATLLTTVPSGTICNVGAGNPVTLSTLIETVERQLERPVPVVHLDTAAGDPWRTAADTTLARDLLDWSPVVDLEAGVADQIAHRLAARRLAGSLRTPSAATVEVAGQHRVGVGV